MPRVGKPSPQKREQEARLAEWKEFEAGFNRSSRGNLWRLYNGVTVSVFKRKDDYFGWSIADDDGPRYSSRGYETEQEAIDALGFELIF